ncbi:MAG: hypothetical protein H0T89_10345 [Deltaproteobacteria bacterium]|nr:hypothetical protein [Deltaproteobacteria bacterium]MDQ3296347.1 hypothetical protein [Myxococcota bacterium]
MATKVDLIELEARIDKLDKKLDEKPSKTDLLELETRVASKADLLELEARVASKADLIDLEARVMSKADVLEARVASKADLEAWGMRLLDMLGGMVRAANDEMRDWMRAHRGDAQ